MSNWKVRVDESYILVERNGSSDVAWIAAQLKVKDALGGVVAPVAQPQSAAAEPLKPTTGRRPRLLNTGDAAKKLGISSAQLRILGEMHRVPMGWEGKRRVWDVDAINATIVKDGASILFVSGAERKAFFAGQNGN